MNYKLVSKAISGIDDRFIAESMTAPAVQKMRVRDVERKTWNFGIRRLVRIAMAACLIFALATTAYAIHYYLGIRDMENDLPVKVDPFIQEHSVAAVLEDWSARITESYCDETQILVTVTVSGGDRYIIAPTDADPDTSVKNIGIDGELTLVEYAREQGKELLFVGASLKENDALGGIGSQAFRNTAPNEMTILIQSNKTDALLEKEIICCVYAVDAQWEKQTLNIPFSLSEAPAENSGQYVPDNVNPFPGMTIGNATVSDSPLGISIRFATTVESQAAFDDIKKVEFDGIVRGEGGWVLEDDGNWWYTVSHCTGEIGDTLVARYYNWDDEEIAVITFKK